MQTEEKPVPGGAMSKLNRRAFFGLFAGVATSLGLGRKAVASAASKTDEYSYRYSVTVTPLPNGASKPAQAAYFIGADGRLWRIQEPITFVVSDRVRPNTIEVINTDLWKAHLAK